MPIRTKIQLPAASPSRRNVLHAGLAAGLAGTALGGCADAEATRRAKQENGLRKRAAKETALLVAAYDATIEAHPDLAAELRPLRAELVRHLEAFGGHELPSPSGSASTGSSSPQVPKGAKAARRALAEAEKRTADARADSLLDAPPELARLLASVAASGAGHVLLLRS